MLEQTRNRGFIRGEIVFTIYENNRDPFTIAKIKIHDTNEDYEEKEIVGKGNFFDLPKGIVYEFYGKLTKHPKFGVQYDIDSYQTFVPETREAIIAYLASDLFPGVGRKTAQKIVDHLGEQAIEKILEDPKSLDGIPGVSKKVKRNLHEQLEENQGFERVALEATKYGIGLKTAQKLYQMYKHEALTIMRENPYRFVFEVEGFGFLTADKIGQMNEIEKTNEERIRASCYYALELGASEGHVYLPQSECIERMKQILKTDDITDERIEAQIDALAEEKKIVKTDGKLYLPSLYYAEVKFSENVLDMIKQTEEMEASEAELLKIIGEIEEEESLHYGAEQYEAIKKAITSKLMILTGGPGTGKTTVIKGIVKTYAKLKGLSVHRHDYDSENDYPFILTAPTGRAAKRLEESTGIRAMTIHRLLGWDGHTYFEKNEYEPLSGELIVIDEFSMVDTWLAHHLFKAIPKEMKVLIVGDEDQLPSVGPGQVLSDLLKSGLIPTVQLNEVYRQKEGSKIIDLAHDIKHDRLKAEQIKKAEDFSFIPCEGSQVVSVIETIFKKAKEKGIDVKDIQVLAPMYKTEAGIDNINYHLQQLINPKRQGKRERKINDVTYRVGDRVLQLVNQPEDGVYNGDIGEIVHILSAKDAEDDEEKIIVRFDDKEVEYTRNEYMNFTLAYCISIHKAQGSEFPNVVLPVVSLYRRMLRKNLLYTAITRSQRSLIICGEIDAFMKGIETVDANKRYTTLVYYLLKHETNESEKLDAGEKEAMLGEGNVDELTPYDFL